jgi:hypothetical protein
MGFGWLIANDIYIVWVDTVRVRGRFGSENLAAVPSGYQDEADDQKQGDPKSEANANANADGRV